MGDEISVSKGDRNTISWQINDERVWAYEKLLNAAARWLNFPDERLIFVESVHCQRDSSGTLVLTIAYG